METDLGIRALCKRDLGLVEDLGGKLDVLTCGPWRAYGNSLCNFVFQYCLAGDFWIGHMYIKQEARGKQGLDFGREALELFFQDTGCPGVLGLTPVDKKAALVFARALGFKEIKRTSEIIVSELLNKGDF